MKVTRETLEGLFKEATGGLAEILHPTTDRQRPLAPTARRQISVMAADVTNLLVDFLSKILSLANIHREVYFSVEFDQFSETSLKAKLSGTRVRSFAEDIKAVTYHEAEVKKNDQGGRETIIVFDI